MLIIIQKKEILKLLDVYVFQSPTEDCWIHEPLGRFVKIFRNRKKLQRIRSNVILQKDSMTLFTNFLDYSISEDIGKYFNGGKTLNGEDTLTSINGYYYANENELYFKENVKVINPRYTINCDTLKHNTKKKISYILGPTKIISAENDSNYIYCENGWYNHNTDMAQFRQNAILVNGKQTLKGDSLFYDRKKRLGRAINNVTAIDSTQNTLLTGDFGEYNEVSESSLVTKKAMFIQIKEGDSLYLHADTLLSLKDTSFTKTDTIGYTLIKGFHRVKLFKSDFQSKCDSLVYSMLDSTIEMHSKPVMWSGKNQITAKFIKIFTKNNEISEVHMNNNALIVAESDTIHYDQIRGTNMIAHMLNKKLRKIDVNDNGALIYFGRDNGELAAINKLTCKNMVIYMNNNEVDTIWFYENPEGTLYPPDYLTEEDLFFDNFEWHAKQRPKNKNDIFIWYDEPTQNKKTEQKKESTKKPSADKDIRKKETIKGNVSRQN
ncbi:MAG: OstA-like protein [Bacteroidales bacterium]